MKNMYIIDLVISSFAGDGIITQKTQMTNEEMLEHAAQGNLFIRCQFPMEYENEEGDKSDINGYHLIKMSSFATGENEEIEFLVESDFESIACFGKVIYSRDTESNILQENYTYCGISGIYCDLSNNTWMFRRMM